MPELSIIIVNFNTKDLVLRCIDSILASRTKVSFEIIVVDNGSTDGSVKEIQKSKFKMQNYSSKFKIIENNENYGFARANNQGIKIAKGRYILLLNSDTEIKGNTLEELVRFSERTKNVGVVGAKLLNIDGSTQASVIKFPSLIGAFKEYWLGEKGAFELYAPETTTPKEVDCIVGAAFLITPEALKKVGLLNERYFMYFEDLDYCRRVRPASLKVYYLPNSEIVHYHGESGKSLVKPVFQWKRLIPSSKIYYGKVKYYLINFIIWSGQKWQKWQKLLRYFH